MTQLILSLLVLMYGVNSFASAPTELSGNNLLTGTPIKHSLQLKEKKATVVVFMSAKCPCSNSHLSVVKDLAKKYSEFQFVAVHSNSDESPEMAKKYFTAAQLPFDVIQDSKMQLADGFKALKTPHVFVVNPQGEILYQGGVTNSASAGSADKNFLAEALEDIHQGREVKTKNGRTLGCIIMREGEHNTWN
jgi:peroxiredoxin